MQVNNFEPQQQQQPAERPGAPNDPMLSERCCTFKIAHEERRHRDFELEQSRILKEIMQKTGTKIEVTTTKDGALNFCIAGEEPTLAAAKNMVLNDFQTGVTLTVLVPRAIYGCLLDLKEQRLATIQDETQTQITIPKKEEDSDIIKIVGLKRNAELAVRAIEKCAREFSVKTDENLTFEHIYILFITGPFNENLKRWEEMGAKVSASGGLLPSKNDRESGQWLRRRRHDGALNRVPIEFYQKVWFLLERSHGISINGHMLMNQLTGETTSGELEFALHVEQVLTSVPQPEYRQLMVEALMLLTTMVERNIVKELAHVIEVDQIIRSAHEIFLEEQRKNKGNSLRCCAERQLEAATSSPAPCGGSRDICQYFYDSAPSGTYGTMTYLIRAYFSRPDIIVE